MKLHWTHCLLIGVLALALGLGSTGCQSPQGQHAGSGNLASVQITGSTTEQIQRAAVAVFTEDYYKLASTNGDMMVFEKEGSRANNLAYGGFAGQSVVVRIKLFVEQRTPGTHLVRCDAFMVRDAGKSFLEDEVPVKKRHSGPYQNYLDQIKKRLGS